MVRLPPFLVVNRLFGSLFPTLSAVAFATKHLTILRDGLATEVPRRDVVGFHLLDLEVLAANGADAILFFVDFSFGIIIECADAKMVLVVVENIMEYT